MLWLERQQGYAEVFLQSYPLEPRDCMLVFSHGGLNTAPIEVALIAKDKGLTVISVSSMENARTAERKHPSEKMLPDIADIAIDNCVPPEDSLVDVGQLENVAAGSTVAAVSVAMSLVAETASILAAEGGVPPTFVSPNVEGVGKDHLAQVYQAFTEFYHRRPSDRTRRYDRRQRSPRPDVVRLCGDVHLRRRHGHSRRHPPDPLRHHPTRQIPGRKPLSFHELRYARHVASVWPDRRPLWLQALGCGSFGLQSRLLFCG